MDSYKNNLQNLSKLKELIEAQRQFLDFQSQSLKIIESNIKNTTIDMEEENQVRNLYESNKGINLCRSNEGRSIVLSTIGDDDMVVRIGDFAEMIKRRGVPYGRNKIHSWLNNRGYTYREGDRNYAKTKFIDEGLFKVKEYVVNRKSGAKIESTIYLTPKGVSYFMEKILREFDKNINLEDM